MKMLLPDTASLVIVIPDPLVVRFPMTGAGINWSMMYTFCGVALELNSPK